jgi:hypothetical protein
MAIVAGSSHTCALRNDGSVVCWGNNGFGQLGTGSTANVGGTPGYSLTAVSLGSGAWLMLLSLIYGTSLQCAKAEIFIQYSLVSGM